MNPILELLGRRLRLAVIGGGPGSFIGPVHRTAARLDDRFEIVAGVLSGDPTRSRKAAAGIGVAPDRAYGDWPALLAGEKARGDGADAVAVMTPNDSHHAICAAALEQGFDVICDKPLDDLAGRCDRPGAAGAGERARVLPDPQLHRLPDGSAGARHGPRRRHRPGAPDPGLPTSRATTPPWWKGEGTPNWRFDPDRLRAVPDPGRHRHPRPPSGRLRLRPGAGGGNGRGLGQRARANRADDAAMRPDALVGRRQRLDVGHQRRGRRRARPGLSHLTAQRAAWNGGRSSPTSCATAASAASSRC